MAGGFVEVQPDSTGKKVAATQVGSDTDTVFVQQVEISENKAREAADLQALILGELRETRRVLCEGFRVAYEENPPI